MNHPNWFKIAMLCLIFQSLSCNKYLDKKSNTSLVTPHDNLQDLQALLDGPSLFKASTPSYGEVSTDEYFIDKNLYTTVESSNPGSQKLYTWRYYPAKSGGNDWAISYKPIYLSNLVLDNLKKIDRTSSNLVDYDQIKGSALFYRSYYFLQLLWNYAKAYDRATADKDWGIALRTTSDFNVKSVRSTNKDGYSKVIKDTKQSITLLPNYSLVPTRPSKLAAYGLLARCYLSMRDYQKCIAYADSALDLNNQLMDYNGDPDIFEPIESKGIFREFNKEIIFYSEMNKAHFLHNTINFSNIDSTMYYSYNDEDLRKRAYFYKNEKGYMSFKGSYAINYTYLFTGIATDEILLTRAECFVRTGKLGNAMKDLNYLLSKRYESGSYTPFKISDQKEALSLILKERQKELIMRGLRWMDIKRLNKEGENIVLKRVVPGKNYTLDPNSNLYALPIPEDIVKLTGIPQNSR